MWATDSCVAVGAISEIDGETGIRLTAGFVEPEGQIVFEGVIRTPGGEVAVSTVLGDQLLSISVGGTAQITMWANDLSEPDLILVSARKPKRPEAAEGGQQTL